MDVDWGKLAQDALGTTDSDGSIVERNELDVDEDDVADHFLDHGVERCVGCGWWVESSSMQEAEHGDMVCEDCA